MNINQANRGRRWKRWGAIVLATLAFILAPRQSSGQPPAAQPDAGASPPDLHLLTSSEHGIVLELRVPAWQVSTQETGRYPLDEISVPGFSRTSIPGTPRLPVKFVTLGIPPGVKPRIQVLQAEGPRVETGYRLPANPSLSLNLDPETLDSPAALTGPPEPQLEPASGDDFFPGELAQVVEEGRLRSQPFVQVRLNPFQYHPQKQELRVYERLQVAVKFDTSTSEVEGTQVDEGPFESALRSLLFNYQAARAWRMPPGTHSWVEPLGLFTGPRFRVEVSQDGLYELTRNDLLQDPNIGTYSLSTFQIYEDFNLSAAREVALEIVDQNGNDRLDPGDAIRFYGQEPAEEEQRYTGMRVYWLVAGPGRGPGKRMATRPAAPGSGTVAPDFPATVHVEDNQRYWSNIPEGVSSTWYWDLLNQTNPGVPLTRDYSVSTPGVSSGSHQVTVRARLVGTSSLTTVTPDHSTELSLNSSSIAKATWDGQKGFFLQGDAASSILSAGANTVQVRIDLLPNVAADVQLVDWLEVDYRRTFQAQDDRLTFARPAGFSEYRITGFSGSNIGAYDVTDPRSPVRLTDTQTPSFGTLRFHDATPAAQKYISVRLQSPALLKPDSIAQVDAGVDLRAATNGATYIIITHADFTAAADRLAGYRAAEFTVKVVQVQDIYNQFGNAVLDAEAIHDFLAYASANWSPSPQYVVLIGDGTYDYRDYLGEPRKIFIPPYQAVVDPWLGETADENYYAAVVGADSVPDLYVGRLPANSPAEADAMVDKILSYESGTAPSTPESVLLVADDYEPWVTLTNFPALSDALATDSLPNSYAVKKVYYRVTHGTVSAARSAITGNINLGQRFVNYIGHAGVERWADEGLWTSSDADLLANAGTYPVVLGMTCLEGAFQDVLRDAVAEAMLRAAKKGAVASWSATGLGVGTGHRHLNHGFYDALFRDGVRRLGPAAVAGKVRLYNTGTNLDLVHTFALLGDPATDTRILVPCVADITGDGTVDANDLAALAPHWHTFIGAPFDQDYNGYINIIDFILVAAGWNSPCGG